MIENKATYKPDLSKYVRPILFGTIAATIIIVLFFTLFSIIMTKTDIPMSIVALFALFAGGAGSFVSGIVSAKISGHKGIIFGVASGATICIILLIAGAIGSQSLFGAQNITKYIAIIVAGVIGGIIGVGSKTRR